MLLEDDEGYDADGGVRPFQSSSKSSTRTSRRVSSAVTGGEQLPAPSSASYAPVAERRQTPGPTIRQYRTSVDSLGGEPPAMPSRRKDQLDKHESDMPLHTSLEPASGMRQRRDQRRSPPGSISPPSYQSTSERSLSSSGGASASTNTVTEQREALTATAAPSTSILPPSAFKYETPMLARDSRVLRSSQAAAYASNGLSTVTRPTIAPRTAPRSTAKTIRSTAAVRAVRVQQYIDPDEEDGEDKENKAAEEDEGGAPENVSPQAQDDKLTQDHELWDMESPGVARGMPLPSTVTSQERKHKWDSGRMLNGGDEEGNPFGGEIRARDMQYARAVSPPPKKSLRTSNGSSSSDHHSRPPSAASGGRGRVSPQAKVIDDRPGSHLPGYELGAGDEEDGEDALSAAGKLQNGHRSQGYPFSRRQPSSAPGSDEIPDPKNHPARAASAAPSSHSVLRKTSAETNAGVNGINGHARRPLVDVQANPLHGRAVSQPAHMSHPHESEEVLDNAIRPKVVQSSPPPASEDQRMRRYEETMRQEAARQRTIPVERIRNWLNGKAPDGNFRDLKTTTVSKTPSVTRRSG